ncbi:alpha/beta hydrolase [Rhodopirellula sp. JC740]|uniref:Alpha/beta hydrolase n=1 Tax=Rhodopirellula halodulae TaxID=2894198 RepID=A0ABS8NMS9_9BACT|nr:alpha/beta hydrolase [Rhodopirellula sp. JC740]MCC9644840.1 alpha/beta hydrolase [Rhodopirellula sp. JC740]
MSTTDLFPASFASTTTPATVAATKSTDVPTTRGGETFAEQAVVFGSHHHLVGVYHQPAQSIDAKTAAIFVTPGMLHHVGPFRLHVDLARTLGCRGLASFRFDLSGIGESLPVGSRGQSIERATDEIRQAIDWLQREHGIEQVILFGLCSGADDSLHAAVRDPRVSGVVAMDACGYRTGRFWIHRVGHYASRLVSARAWKRMLGRRLPRHNKNSAPAYRSIPMGTDLREFPSRKIALQEFQRLVDQGCRLHLVYTGGVSEYYNYENQFFDMLRGVRWKNHATVDFRPEMDHVAMLCEDRKWLVNRVCEQMIEFVHTGPTQPSR